MLIALGCGNGPQTPKPLPQPTPPAVTITVSPDAITTLSGRPTQFAAQISAPPDQNQITWSVVEGNAGGTISSTGLYLAPEAQGTFHVKATSVANPAVSSTAAVSVGTALPPIINLWAIWGSSAKDVWVVGDVTTYHWDGANWHSEFVPSRFGPIADHVQGLWGNGPNDIWQVGNSLTMELKHWDGTTWTDFPPNITAHISGLWGSGPNDVWAFGGTSNSAHLHWDGTSWTFDFFQPTVGVSFEILAGWGSAANDVWAVGSGDETGQRQPGTAPGASIFHWDGTAWTQNISGLNSALNAIWGFSSTDIWTVGWNGLIAHWDGVTWTPVPSGTTERLDGIWGSAANDVWAVGASGTILHWDGTSWTQHPSSTLNDLHAVWGSSPTDIWIAGNQTLMRLP